MKVLIIIAVLGVATAIPFTEEQLKKGQQYVKKCLDETKISPETVGKLKAGDFSEDDENVQCFALCFFREAQFTDADGNQNKDVIINKLSVDKDPKSVEAVYSKCKNETGSTPCQKAFNAYKCYRTAGLF
ncbi:hypothetical protein PVAND_011906 [Polypedilum vanderplanki]|uniref:Odorant binding protein n=1 Tax=Polypedilum vanderplanki TaxID=319348 RepID=A0A9J6CK06_POLVA|nr:hypothetical protein PVAND_011906 [Polypedilum vanderplanki]